ncbi:unnamed protein product [Hydatigera taeniaeformis]|uniref:Uncharacterized protein n=1 Tax=Hydatigena taeniaeformis TaxID=6205 RepID=A0A0R3X785_HYDTA|nr:unnamed protein product [Hydatigera taeniaeformis]
MWLLSPRLCKITFLALSSTWREEGEEQEQKEEEEEEQEEEEQEVKEEEQEQEEEEQKEAKQEDEKEQQEDSPKRGAVGGLPSTSFNVVSNADAIAKSRCGFDKSQLTSARLNRLPFRLAQLEIRVVYFSPLSSTCMKMVDLVGSAREFLDFCDPKAHKTDLTLQS